jgi:hypothetical protein
MSRRASLKVPDQRKPRLPKAVQRPQAPMRGSTVGPPCSAIWISASITVCLLFLGNAVLRARRLVSGAVEMLLDLLKISHVERFTTASTIRKKVIR